MTPWTVAYPGSSIHGIFQARVLEWVAVSSPGDLPNPGIKPGSPALQADALLAELLGEPPNMVRLLSRIFIDTFLGKLVLGMVSEKWKAF